MSTTTQIDDNLKKSHLYKVEQVRKKIESGKIKSPPIAGRVWIKKNTYMVPKIKLRTPEEVEAWRNKMIEKFKL
jgi:hypothetical protein